MPARRPRGTCHPRHDAGAAGRSANTREDGGVGTIKTRPTGAEVTAFLDSVPGDRRRAEGHQVRALFEQVTGDINATAAADFARRAKAAGKRLWVVLGEASLSVRMYRSNGEMLEGFGKNLYALVGESLPKLAVALTIFYLAALQHEVAAAAPRRVVAENQQHGLRSLSVGVDVVAAERDRPTLDRAHRVHQSVSGGSPDGIGGSWPASACFSLRLEA